MYVGNGKCMPKKAFEEAELKLTVATRAANVAKHILERELKCYSVVGPTIKEPNLIPFPREDITLITGKKHLSVFIVSGSLCTYLLFP